MPLFLCLDVCIQLCTSQFRPLQIAVPTVSFCINPKSWYQTFPDSCTWMPGRVWGAQPTGVSVRPRWLLRSPFAASLELSLLRPHKTHPAHPLVKPWEKFSSLFQLFCCFVLFLYKNRSSMKNAKTSLWENPAVNFS